MVALFVERVALKNGQSGSLSVEYSLTVFLLLLVLTNDQHHYFFTFLTMVMIQMISMCVARVII